MTACAVGIARWIAHHPRFSYRLKKSLLKRIEPQLLDNYEFETDFFGLSYTGNARNAIDRAVLFCGAYEKYLLFFLRDVIRSRGIEGKATVVDVGANLGVHSLFLSQYVAEVHAFEPYPPVRQRFEAHIAKNNIRNIHVHAEALGEEAGEAPFFTPPEGNLGTGSFHETHQQKSGKTLLLKLRKGDAALKVYELQRLDILKVDVEGHEVAVLRGLRHSLEMWRPLTVFEVTQTTWRQLGEDAAEEALRALFPPDYAFYAFTRKNRDTGAYALRPWNFDARVEAAEIVACPEDWELH